MKYDVIIYIGRFQPFHNGHYNTVKRALELAKTVVVLVGSSGKPRTIKDPFTFEEREDMISGAFPKEDLHHLHIEPLYDSLYDDNDWAQQVQEYVEQWGPDAKVGLIGFLKDESSYYLKMFPQWDLIQVENTHIIDATRIREFYFIGDNSYLPIPKYVSDFLDEFEKTAHYEQLIKEFEFINKYKLAWANSPYQPTFVTVDAVVFYCGHVLMVKRKAEPGKGLWALPGGFIGANEFIDDACLRELKEETKIELFDSEILSMKKGTKVFDHPKRSLRGRTITHATNFSIMLPIPRLNGKLPKVKGSDDAVKAKWFPFQVFLGMTDQTFEDHQSIVRFFL